MRIEKGDRRNVTDEFVLTGCTTIQIFLSS